MTLTIVPEAVESRGGLRRSFTSEEDARILELLAAGTTYQDIAAALGRSRSGVEHRGQHLKRIHASPTRKPSARQHAFQPYTSQDDAIILEMLADGANASAIAKRLGRTKAAVRQHVRDLRPTESGAVYAPPPHCICPNCKILLSSVRAPDGTLLPLVNGWCAWCAEDMAQGHRKRGKAK